MFKFLVVRCPSCPRKGDKAHDPVVGEIFNGLSRFKCRLCRRRIRAHSDGKTVRISVDTPRRRLDDLPAA